MDNDKTKIAFPEAREVLDIFAQLNKVPRPSWHEEKAADFLCAFAEKNGLEYLRDEHNCVVIRKPATAGYEDAEPVALLNHMDMVCVAKPGVDFDPLTSPIEAYVDNGWMKANGTSLGADNGIGLSMALAVLQSNDIPHPALEVITTTNEEDGMTGAANLSHDFLKARKIINLDSEDYDTITLGSAGAFLQFTKLPYKRLALEERVGYKLVRLEISGGLGGHSGVDINKGRANAIKLMADFLHDNMDFLEIRICKINGGEANNSIAASCVADIAIPYNKIDNVKLNVAEYQQKIKDVYGKTDGGLTFSLNETSEKPETIIEPETGKALIEALFEMPYGPLAMSNSLPDTVETSNNTGKLTTEDDHIFVSNYSRSFIDADVAALGKQIRDTFDKAGATTELIMEAPAWQSDINSDFVGTTEKVFVDLLGFSPKKVAMHFALEAGYFVQKYEGLEMVSIGPKIIEPHSVTERVSIETINNIWAVAKELLKRCR